MTYTTTCRQTGNKRKNGNSGASIAHDLRMCKNSERVYDPSCPPEVIKHIPIKQAYEDIFGNALEEYNLKQSREERKIADYFEKIDRDKQKNTFYEFVFSMGKYEQKELNGKQYKKDAEKLHEVCKEIAEEFESKYNHIKVIGAYWHSDEQGVSHMHLDYIPFATEQTRGLKTQNSLHKAIEQMGYKDTPQLDEDGEPIYDENGKPVMKNKVQFWCEEIANDFNAKLKAKGIQIEKADKHGRGFNISKKVYKEIANEIEKKIEKETKGFFKKEKTERAELMTEMKAEREETRELIRATYPTVKKEIDKLNNDKTKLEKEKTETDQKASELDYFIRRENRIIQERTDAEIAKRKKEVDEYKRNRLAEIEKSETKSKGRIDEYKRTANSDIADEFQRLSKQNKAIILTNQSLTESNEMLKREIKENQSVLDRLKKAVSGLIAYFRKGGENGRIRNNEVERGKLLHSEYKHYLADKQAEKDNERKIQQPTHDYGGRSI